MEDSRLLQPLLLAGQDVPHALEDSLPAPAGGPLLTARVRDWMTAEDLELARRLAVRAAEHLIALGEQAGGESAFDSFLGRVWPLPALAGTSDVGGWWALLDRFPPRARYALLEALEDSPWPEGPASLMRWLNAHDYQAPRREKVLWTLEVTGHPDRARFAFTRLGTPDERKHWIPYPFQSKPEEWEAYRAKEPWPARARAARGEDVTPEALSRLAREVRAVTGRTVPRRDQGGSPRDAALRDAWREELLAASEQAVVTPIHLAEIATPGAAAQQRAEQEAAFRRAKQEAAEHHAALHRRAQELVERFTPSRLGAAWVAALQSGEEGARHRSALYGRALLDALEPDVENCGGCSLKSSKRNISQRLNARIVLASGGGSDAFAARRNDWESFRSAPYRELEVPLSFLVWSVESYLSEAAPAHSPSGVELLIQLLAAWDHSLLRALRYEGNPGIRRVARHLAAEPVGAEPGTHLPGVPGAGLLRGLTASEAELLVRALLAAPFVDDVHGAVENALLGEDSLAAFREAPTAPFPRLFRDAAAREQAIASLARGPAVEEERATRAGAPDCVVFECEEGRATFRFAGPKAAALLETLVAHARMSWPDCEAVHADRSVILRGFGVDVSSVMDQMLDVSDCSEPPLLGRALRAAVVEAAGAHGDDLEVAVR